MCALVFTVSVMIDYIYKYPRLYLNVSFEKKASLPLMSDHVHYLRNVLRKVEGDNVRVFNGVDGEWLARIEKLGKKQCVVSLEDCIRAQTVNMRSVGLFFSPIKKQRMDIMIEKAVELGVTDLHPVIMSRTVLRKINKGRMTAQIIEASEQSERLDIPVLHPACASLEGVSLSTAIYACVERGQEIPVLSSFDLSDDCAFLIGPEGGFNDQEKEWLKGAAHIIPVGLGEGILRTETAAMACLSYAQLSVLPNHKKK